MGSPPTRKGHITMKKYQRQSPVGYKRRNMGTAVIHATEKKIQSECRKYNVSRSFVIAVALAHYFDVSHQEPYAD